MKKNPLLYGLPALLIAITGLAAMAPGLMSPVARALAVNPYDLGGIAVVLFLALCVSVGLAVLITRLGLRPGLAVAAGALGFVLCIVLWPARITVHKDPQAEQDVDSGFFVYRPF